MRRVTKAELARAIETAIEFNRLPFKAISAAGENIMRNKKGFISSCRYGRGVSIALDRYEMGLLDGVRYRRKSRKGERRQ